MNKEEEPVPPLDEKTGTRLVFPILLIVTVFFASGNSLHLNVPKLHSPDKVVHFLIFGLMATLVIRVAYDPKRPWRSGLIAILTTSLYGIVDEFRQSFTPGRSVEVLDWMADTIGAIVATSFYIYATPWRGFLERSFSLRKMIGKTSKPDG